MKKRLKETRLAVPLDGETRRALKSRGDEHGRVESREAAAIIRNALGIGPTGPEKEAK